MEARKASAKVRVHGEGPEIGIEGHGSVWIEIVTSLFSDWMSNVCSCLRQVGKGLGDWGMVREPCLVLSSGTE